MQSERPSRLLLFARDCAGVGLSLGLLSLLVALINAQTEQATIGRAFIIYGAIATAIASLVLLAVRRRAPLGPAAVLGVGIAPFAVFAIFIVWRTGVSNDQRADCEAGVAQRCLDLANRRYKRDKVDDALALMTRGCELGLATSCVRLAALMTTVRGDEDATAELLVRACELDSGLACFRAAHMTTGEDADALIERSCALGYAAACVDLAR